MSNGRIFWGGILVLIGVLILLDNLGVFGLVNVWDILGPILLILLGAWLLIGWTRRRPLQMESIAVALEGASRAKLTLNHGVGRLQVGAGHAGEYLLEGECEGGVKIVRKMHPDELSVSLSVPEKNFPILWVPFSMPGSFNWNIRIHPEIPLNLVFQTGVNESKLDLTDLLVHNVIMKTGVSSTLVRLPKQAGETFVHVQSGVSSVELIIPDGVAARVRADLGLASLSIDRTRFPRQAGYYQSSNYDTAVNRVNIKVDTGIGSVVIRQE